MTLAEEYRLSEYEELGLLRGTKDIYIVRNIMDGTICVKKRVPVELENIYTFLKILKSSYTPHIYECVRCEDTLIIIEEYLPGKNLEEILRERCFSKEETVSIGIQLCQALAPLHHANPPIICRDLKASNIMLTEGNSLKIVDFDISRVYQAGQNRDTKMMGTEGYAAPEQFGFRQTDARTDIYAMGVLLNYMILHKFPVEKVVVGQLGMIIRRCVEMNPDDRFQDVEELEKALWKIQGQERRDTFPKEVEGKKHKENLLPPGFRSGKIWKKIIAVWGYLTIAAICFGMELSTADRKLSKGMERIEQTVIFLTMLLFVALLFNYRNIKKSFSILNSERRGKRVLGYVFAGLLLFVGAAFVCAILETILIL